MTFEQDDVTASRTKNNPRPTMVPNRALFCLAAAALFAAVGCSASSEPGSPGTGGSHSTGGSTATGGTTATGGSPATGGMDGSGTGGRATGGNTGAGGNAGTGGNAGGGGTSAIGGNTATGGTTATGGSGGAAGGAGGAAGVSGTGSGGAGTTCTPARTHAPGTSTVNMQSGGMARDYVLHIPPSYDGTTALPLVFDVHGYTSFATEQLMRSKWDQMADKEHFVLIDPDGINKSWNAGNCCGSNNVDDVTFFRDMVKKASAELCIDTKRVYVSGHSNGGAMTYRLACEAPDIFAAANPVCGWMGITNCKPSRPIAMLEIRAFNDTTVQYDGGGVAGSAASELNLWLGFDTCAGMPVISSQNGVCTAHTSCAQETQVMECHPRGNHNFFYATNPDHLLVPDTAWPFFKQFALP